MRRTHLLAAALTGLFVLAALAVGSLRWSAAARSAPVWLVAVVDAGALPGQEWEGYVCSGALLSPTVVVTAAHCVTDRSEELDVVLSAADLCSAAPRTRIIGRKIHARFDPGTLEHDVALLELETPAAQATATLASTPTAVGASAAVAGYGPSRSTDLWECRPSRKQVKVRHPQACSGSPGASGLVFRPSSHLCVGGNGDAAEACPGDSGAPLLTKERFGSATLVGLVSWGVRCGDAVPGAYVDLVAERPWIDAALGSLSEMDGRPLNESGTGLPATATAAQPTGPVGHILPSR